MMDSNLNQELRETQMGERRKLANMAADERFLEREAQDEGAYQSAKQKNRAAIFENIGNINFNSSYMYTELIYRKDEVILA